MMWRQLFIHICLKSTTKLEGDTKVVIIEGVPEYSKEQ